MKIFIDINHPAHVHYFKNFIKIVTNKGHKVMITARDRDVAIDLLTKYKITFYNNSFDEYCESIIDD